MDKAIFFKTVKVSIFDGHLNQAQVDGIEAIFSACQEYGITDKRQIAALLATPCIETGESFEPIVESLNYTPAALISKFGKFGRITSAQANLYGRTPAHPANQRQIGNLIYGGEWGRINLGNTLPNDGYDLRGRGLVQWTGRRLYAMGVKLIGVDLLATPARAAEIGISTRLMVVGSRDGLMTGKKLSDYINSNGRDYKNARRIVNGTDRADDYANYCRLMEKALNLAG